MTPLAEWLLTRRPVAGGGFEKLRFGYAAGDVNCLTWAADWAVSCGRADPAAGHRGPYASPAAARRFVRRAGGLLQLAARGCSAARLERIDPDEARPGDVGVGLVGETAWGFEPVGLIRAGGFWAWLIEAGGVGRAVIGPAEVLGSWRV